MLNPDAGSPRNSPHARAVYFAGRRISDREDQRERRDFMQAIAAQVKMRLAEIGPNQFDYDRKQAGPKDTFRSPLDVAENRLYLRELAKAPDVSDPQLAVYQEWARGQFGIVRKSRRASLADPTEVSMLNAITALFVGAKG